MAKYKLYINQYNIMINDYKVREEIVDTDDIYHTIGKIYCTSLAKIKRIDYEKIDKEKELQQRIDKAIEYIEKETKELYSKNRCCKYLGEIMQLEYVLNILRGEDK